MTDLVEQEQKRKQDIVQIGTAVGKPGEISYGWFEIVELPTGGLERLPVIICQGREPGPVFWFTAGIHGDELVGVAALHDVITAELAQQLRGTVVAIPSLNPAGLLTEQRKPYYNVGDPNRSFPGYKKPKQEEADGTEINSIYEEAMSRLFDVMKDSADFLIDLHTFGLQATPFTIRDRVLYHEDGDKAEAESLLDRTDELIAAFGLPVVNEYLAGKYFDQKLHRSTSGAALNEARIPSFTVEMGNRLVEPASLEAAKTGVLNSLKWAKMLDGEIQPITTVPVPALEFSTKRSGVPKAPATGLIRYRVRPGEVVKQGDIIATLHDIYGRLVPKNSEIRAEHDGWIISLSQHLICYQGSTVCNMAIRDDEPMLVPYPKEKD